MLESVRNTLSEQNGFLSAILHKLRPVNKNSLKVHFFHILRVHAKGLSGYKFKGTKHDMQIWKETCSDQGWEDRRSIDGEGCERLPQVNQAVFFFFLRLSNNFRFAFLALKVASQAFTWKISICSANSNHVLRCLLSGELATGRARLQTADRVAASQLQLT